MEMITMRSWRLGFGFGLLALVACDESLSSLSYLKLERIPMILQPDYGRRGQTVKLLAQLPDALLEKTGTEVPYPNKMDLGGGMSLVSFSVEEVGGRKNLSLECYISYFAGEGERRIAIEYVLASRKVELFSRFWVLPPLPQE